jgi:hypothetical protein
MIAAPGAAVEGTPSAPATRAEAGAPGGRRRRRW